MKNLLREFIRSAIREVDVLPGGQDAHANAARKLSSSSQAASTPEKSGERQKATAGKAYQSKEETRKKVQDLILQKVRSGGVSKDDDIVKYLSDEETLRKDGQFGDDEDLNLATTALRGVPMSVWQQIR